MGAVRDRPLSGADYARFCDLIARTSGIEMPEIRRPDLETAVRRVLVESGLTSTDALYRLMTEDPAGWPLLETLVGALTVGETHFFRNRPQFEALERRVLPELIERRRAERRLRIWSAGCASGEEPYSLAIVLRRLLPDLSAWNVTILATDIDRSALETARRAIYRPWSFREVPADVGNGWFMKRPEGLEVRGEVRDLVTFDYLNLARDEYPSLHNNTNAMDLIMCRNVLMYFAVDTARRVATRLHSALADRGWLIVGHAEPSQDVFHAFEAVNLPGTVLYRKAVVSDPPETIDPSRMRADVGDALRGRVYVGVGSASRLPKPPTPTDVDLPYTLAKRAANRLEIEVAEQWIETALRRSPLDARSHYLRGLLWQEEGDREAALAAYRRCVYADPTFVLGHFALAGIFEQIGRYPRARKHLDNVHALLANRDRGEVVAEADGVTVGRLLELVAVHRGLMDASSPEGH